VSEKRLGWPTHFAIFIVLVTAVLYFSRSLDGSLFLMSWPFQVAGLLMVGFEFYRTRRWWLLILATPLILPLMLWLMLLYSCYHGDCL
jgi:hypothetical protein